MYPIINKYSLTANLLLKIIRFHVDLIMWSTRKHQVRTTFCQHIKQFLPRFELSCARIVRSDFHVCSTLVQGDKFGVSDNQIYLQAILKLHTWSHGEQMFYPNKGTGCILHPLARLRRKKTRHRGKW